MYTQSGLDSTKKLQIHRPLYVYMSPDIQSIDDNAFSAELSYKENKP